MKAVLNHRNTISPPKRHLQMILVRYVQEGKACIRCLDGWGRRGEGEKKTERGLSCALFFFFAFRSLPSKILGQGWKVGLGRDRKILLYGMISATSRHFSWCFDFGKYGEKYDWCSCFKLLLKNKGKRICHIHCIKCLFQSEAKREAIGKKSCK